MGTVTQQLALAAMEAGAQLETGRPVVGISVQGCSVSGVQLADGTEVGAQPVQQSLRHMKDRNVIVLLFYPCVHVQVSGDPPGIHCPSAVGERDGWPVPHTASPASRSWQQLSCLSTAQCLAT